jgi:Uma2 family endonuclease
MSTALQTYLTPEQYLEIERAAEYRSEYFNGEMFAMAGASEAHALIVTNFVRELSTRLRGRPCRVYSNDIRVKVDRTGLYTYPDVVIACGEIQFEDDRRDTLLDPVVVVEVLSPSTAAYDRGIKFGHYKTISSLSEYVLVAQDRVHVEHFVREPDREEWLYTALTNPGQTLHLPALGVDVPVSEIYYLVELSPEEHRRPGPPPPAR